MPYVLTLHFTRSPHGLEFRVYSLERRENVELTLCKGVESRAYGEIPVDNLPVEIGK